MTAQCQVTESKLQGAFSCFVNKRAIGKLIDKFVWLLRTSVLYDPSLCWTILVCVTDHTWTNVQIGATQVPSQDLAFTWLNGEPVNVTATRPFWEPKKPLKVFKNGLLLMRRYKHFLWSETRRGPRRHSICERPFLQWGCNCCKYCPNWSKLVAIKNG